MTKSEAVQKLSEVDGFFRESLGQSRVYFDIQQSLIDLKNAAKDVENLKEGGNNGKR
jgi:hypothetical protein